MRLRTFRHYENDEMPLSVQGSGDGDSVLTDIDDASSHRWSDVDSDVGTSDMSCTWEESAREQSIPSMQLHFSVQWLTSTIRLSLTSSLQIAYHDDTVMSLPISLIITGLHPTLPRRGEPDWRAREACVGKRRQSGALCG